MNLEPRRGACYRVIAGMRRLRAAHRIGLNTVPCLVHDADEERLADMRRARDRLRWGVLTDLAAVEISRTKLSAGRTRCYEAILRRKALTGLLQCLLTLAPRTGTVLSVRAQTTTIRPALAVECQLRECDPELSVEVLARFFEAGWREHPCGPNGGSILAALAHTARAHGGRAGVKAAANGCLVTFVVPRVDQ